MLLSKRQKDAYLRRQRRNDAVQQFLVDGAHRKRERGMITISLRKIAVTKPGQFASH